MKHEIDYVQSFNVVGEQMYGPLKDPEFFKQVKLDDEVQTLVWPNGADFDPSTLYHWEQYVEELSCRAKEWQV